MIRSTAALVAGALAVAPAFAASYAGKPASPATQRFITGDIVWRCGPAGCRGATETSRPAILCQSLAKRAGRLESFSVDGRSFSAEELDRCNSAARSR